MELNSNEIEPEHYNEHILKELKENPNQSVITIFMDGNGKIKRYFYQTETMSIVHMLESAKICTLSDIYNGNDDLSI